MFPEVAGKIIRANADSKAGIIVVLKNTGSRAEKMRKLTIIVVSVLVFILISSSCTPQATPTPAPTASPAPRATTVAPPAATATTAAPKPTATATKPPAPVALPKTVSMTTFQPGTTSYVASLAMGGVLSKYVDIKLAVEPVISPALGYARLAKGEVEFVFGGGTMTYGAYTGTLGNPKYSKVRDMFFTYRSNFAFMTRNDTGIKTIADLKGRKISCIFPAAPANEQTVRTVVKEYGMDFDKDIVATKYSTIIEMYENLREKRVDAVFGTALRLSVEEQDRSPGGAYIISIPKENFAAMQKDFPMYFRDTFAAGFPGTTADTYTIFFGYGPTTGADVPDDLVYTVVKTVLENIAEIKPSHADLVDFSVANFAKYPTVPFHNGAIKYYKEKGIWTNELENFQKAILAKGN